MLQAIAERASFFIAGGVVTVAALLVAGVVLIRKALIRAARGY